MIVDTFTVGGSSSSSGTTPANGGSSSSSSATTTTLGGSSSEVRVLLVLVAPPSSNTILTEVDFVNTSKTDLDLTEFRLRYWLTAELGGSNLVPEADSGPALQRVTVCAASPSRSGADSYIEIAFDGGSVLAASSVRLSFRTHKADWTDFDQSNDYSYPGDLSVGSELTKISVYRNNVLVAGSEP